MGLLPMSSFAATAVTDVSEEDVLNVLEDEAMLMDRGGGGMYYPGPYGGGITVDASVTKEVTPDFIAVNGYCEVTNMDTREEVRTELTRLYNAIKEQVGTDGRVRRSGTPGIYPYYDPSGALSSKLSGNLSLFIRVARPAASQKISDILEENGCSASWDVRLVDTEDHEYAQLDNLLARVNKRKAIYEKLLGKKLTNVAGVSLSTWVDGWSTYDPETNKADATTTLSITFDIGTNASVQTTPPHSTPRG